MSASRVTLFRSENLHLFASPVTGSEGGSLVFCFQQWVGTPSLDGPCFGEHLLRKERIPSLFLTCASNAWWQYRELPDALDAARAFTSRFDETVSYGSSMGGYAALRFAEHVGARRCVAIAPQFSPRKAIVPAEHRYDKDIQDVAFIFEDVYLPTSNTANFVVYDPFLRIDVDHVNCIARHAALHHIKIPASGHPPLSMLLEQGRVHAVTMSLLRGDLDIIAFSALQRALRRRTYRYWEQMSFRLGERRRFASASRFAEQGATIAGRRDEALDLARKWALIGQDRERALELDSMISARTT